MDQKRIATGINGLDTMLHGGFVPGSSILVRGAPGTGKTTLAFHYLAHGIKQGARGLMISFEEFPASLYRDAESLGWDLRALEADDKLHMMFTSPGVFLRGLEATDGPINRLLHGHDIKRVALDSLTHFVRMANDPHELRHIYNRVINGLKRAGITSMFLGEEIGTRQATNRVDSLPFVVDCMVLMRYLEIESSIRRAILVLKMRSSAHDTAIHSYTIGKGGIKIGAALTGHSGLLSGLASHSIISSVR